MALRHPSFGTPSRSASHARAVPPGDAQCPACHTQGCVSSIGVAHGARTLSLACGRRRKGVVCTCVGGGDDGAGDGGAINCRCRSLAGRRWRLHMCRHPLCVWEAGGNARGRTGMAPGAATTHIIQTLGCTVHGVLRRMHCVWHRSAQDMAHGLCPMRSVGTRRLMLAAAPQPAAAHGRAARSTT